MKNLDRVCAGALAGCALLSSTISWAVNPTTSALRPQSTLQFTDIGNVKDWRGAGDTTVYIMDKAGQWYRAEMVEACMTLNTKNGISFITETDPDTKARVSKVVVDRHICTVTSLAKVAAPPPEK